MKPTRPPIRAFGNAVMMPQHDQRMQRNQSVQAQTHNEQPKTIVRNLSQNHEHLQMTHIPTHINQRGHSPTIINRQPMQETIKYQNIQNNNEQQSSTQFFKVTHPIRNNQQVVDTSIKQSYIMHQQPQLQQQQPQQPQQLQPQQYYQPISPRQAELNQQKDRLIKQQAEQIQNLQQALSDKVHQHQQLQEKHTVEFKKFQEDILQQMGQIELNVQQNEYTVYFMNEIDRKVQNLQNNINEQIKELQSQFEYKQKTQDNLTKNVQANTSIRMGEDESFFKGELDILENKLALKVDKSRAEQMINTQMSALQSQYSTQLQQANHLLNKINSDKTEELTQIKLMIQSTLQQLNDNVSKQLQNMYNMVNDNTQAGQQQQQDKKQIMQQMNAVSNKFQQLQQQYIDKMQQWQCKVQQLEQDKQELLNKVQQQQQTIQQQQTQIEMVNVKPYYTNNSPQTTHMSPQINKQSSFFSNSTTAGQTQNKIKKLVKQSIPKQQMQKKGRTTGRGELSLEDFVDFNENSINESVDSLDLNETCGFNKRSTLFSNQDFQSPAKNVFNNSQLLSINKMLSDDNIPKNQPQQPQQPQQNKNNNKQIRNRSAPSTQLNALTKAIKRRQLYLGKGNQPLMCTYSGQQLSDVDMGLYLLDDNGNPFVVSGREMEELVGQQMIQII